MEENSEVKPLKLKRLKKNTQSKISNLSKRSIKPVTIMDVLNNKTYERRVPTRLETFSDGFDLIDQAVKKWNAQPNPPKVFVGGYRIHHGLAGLAATVFGLITEYQPLVGMGTRLMIDDIADFPDWFNFEK